MRARGGSRLRVVSLVIVALVVFPLVATASGPATLTLNVETQMLVGRAHRAVGHLTVAGAPLPFQDIKIYVDGALVDTTRTDARGQYALQLFVFTAGPHTAQAVWGEGATESRSPLVQLHGIATTPTFPDLPRAVAGYYLGQATVTWEPPFSDGGSPLTRIDVTRSVDNGTTVLVWSGLGSGFVDGDIERGRFYRYNLTAYNAHGASVPTKTGLKTIIPLANVSVDGFYLCDGASCGSVVSGGSFPVAPGANVSVSVRLRGVVDDEYPIVEPGLSARAAEGTVHLQGRMANFSATTNLTGWYVANRSEMWAFAPAAGCEPVPVVAAARVFGQGRLETNASFDLCAV